MLVNFFSTLGKHPEFYITYIAWKRHWMRLVKFMKFSSKFQHWYNVRQRRHSNKGFLVYLVRKLIYTFRVALRVTIEQYSVRRSWLLVKGYQGSKKVLSSSPGQANFLLGQVTLKAYLSSGQGGGGGGAGKSSSNKIINYIRLARSGFGQSKIWEICLAKWQAGIQVLFWALDTRVIK